MSSDTQQRFESLQREFAAYAEHVTTQAPKPKSKSKPKQEPVAVADPIAIEETIAPRKRGRKPKSDEATVVAHIVC
jgi:hypothetical protein